MNQRSNLTALNAAIASVAVSFCAVGPSAASTLIASNLAGGDPEQYIVRQSGGDPLLAGSQGTLGAFPGMTEAQIVECLDAAGLAALLDAFVQIGDPFTVGQGSGADGYFEVVARDSLTVAGDVGAALGETPFLVFLDAPSAEAATEVLVVKIAAASFPTDPEIGLESYLAVHLRDAEAVVGTSDATGFIARPIPPAETVAFDDWILAMLGEGAPATDLRPLDDPDRDGLDNLAEFGMGFHPAHPDFGDRPTATVAEDGNTVQFVFRHRPNAEALAVTVETSDTLRGPWTAADIPFRPADSSGLPPGIKRASVALPLSGEAQTFARLRFELAE